MPRLPPTLFVVFAVVCSAPACRRPSEAFEASRGNEAGPADAGRSGAEPTQDPHRSARDARAVEPSSAPDAGLPDDGRGLPGERGTGAAPPIVFESPDYDAGVPSGPFALGDLPAGTAHAAVRGETKVRRIEPAERVELHEYGFLEGGWQLLFRAAAPDRTRGAGRLPRLVLVTDYPIADGEYPRAVLALVEAADRTAWVYMDGRAERSLPLVGVGVAADPAARTRVLARSPTVRYMTACPGSGAACLLYGPPGDVARATDPVQPPGGWWLRELPAEPEPDRSEMRPLTSLRGEGSLADLALELRVGPSTPRPGSPAPGEGPVLAGAWLCRGTACTHAFAWRLEDPDVLALRIDRDRDMVVASVWEPWYGRRLLAWFEPGTIRRVDRVGLVAVPHEPRGAPFRTVYPHASATGAERLFALLGGPGRWPEHAVVVERPGERGRFVRLVVPEIDEYYDPNSHPRWPAELELRRSGCPGGARECLVLAPMP